MSAPGICCNALLLVLDIATTTVLSALDSSSGMVYRSDDMAHVGPVCHCLNGCTLYAAPPVYRLTVRFPMSYIPCPCCWCVVSDDCAVYRNTLASLPST